MKAKPRRNSGKSTLADVAKMTGVSTMTVSRALREPDKVSPQVRDKIEAAINELGYVPNLAASNLASSTSRLITMIVPALNTPGCAPFSQALHQSLKPKGYNVILAEDHYTSASESRLVEMMLSYNPAAMVMFDFDCSEDCNNLLLKTTLPVVQVGGVMISPIGVNIGINYGLAIKQLINALALKGYQNIGLLCGAHEHHVVQQILSGWHSAMLSLNQSPHRIVSSSLPPDIDSGQSLLPEILLTWPELDLLICTSDELACGAIAACHKKGISVPAQLAITGLGDSNMAQICSPALTTVAIPYKQMGSLTGKYILDVLEGKEMAENLTLPTQLMMRGSTLR
ncbi:MAG: LacI family DNA-binding transcriptional regulator [Rouxiella aceris]|uniref:LacI family DNA-binding transcriptional regulator n=1 Tax=Rouxiella aceris TaxID=2703884 RepID=UPI00283F204E|nr:LacI family DNA-binding transcriptional regulator [Rouxiella aceris]MDR3431866.1 LacI family DNA-binding transcriptional regulator [Rouxiella aceris]